MKSLKALLGLVIIVGGIYVAYKVIPPYFNNYQFQDVLETEARMNSYGATVKSEDDIRAGIFKKAQELDVPLLAEQIKVARTGREVVISADYTVHIDLPVYPLDLQFHPTSKK